MGKIYSKSEILRNLNNKYDQISSTVKKGYTSFTGKSSGNASDFKKGVANMLSGKSEQQRDEILRKMKVDYSGRKKFEEMVSGKKKISKEEIARQQKKEIELKKQRVKMGLASAELLENRRTKSGALRNVNKGVTGDYTRLGISDKVGHGASIRGKKISMDDARRGNVKNLSNSNKSTSIAPGTGVKNNLNSGTFFAPDKRLF